MIRALNIWWLRWNLRNAQLHIAEAMHDEADARARRLKWTRDAAELQRRCLVAEVPALRGRRA